MPTSLFTLSVCCRAIDNTKAAHIELDNKAQVADAALANSQSDIEKLQVEFNEASGLVQQKEQELREAKEAAEQKAKQLDVARYTAFTSCPVSKLLLHSSCHDCV